MLLPLHDSDSAPAAASPAPVSAAPAEDGPAPRLCHLKIWPDYQGYGFNLHAEKEKGKGQYVGKVDDGSPAEAAGLKDGDKIIEVNGKNVSSEDHRNVVGEIKSDPTQVKLLVVDSTAFNYYKERDINVHGGMSNVDVIVCPDAKGLGKIDQRVLHLPCTNTTFTLTRPCSSCLCFSGALG